MTGILSSKTIVAIEVHQEGNELLVQMGMTLDVHLGHFHSSTDNIYAQKVEYVRASIDIAMLAVGERQPVGVIIFNLPAEWQWVPAPKTVAVMTCTLNLEMWACKPSAPAEVPGRWMHVGGGRAAEETCKTTEVVNAAAPLARAESSSDIQEFCSLLLCNLQHISC